MTIRRIVTPGLAPSLSLAPSLTLAPAATVYAGGPISPNQIWMQLGAGNTLIDVSPYVEFGEGITYTYGRQTEFDDTNPGTFTFTLNNADGRFTPENPNSPYAETVTEGVAVEWLLGTRLIRFNVLTVEIPADEATWDHLVVTCDDMLGTAGRHGLTALPDALTATVGPDLMWLLDDAENAPYSPEQHSDPIGAFNLTRSNPSSTVGGVTYGVTQAPGLPGTAITLTAANGETNWYGTRHNNTSLTTGLTSPALTAGGSTHELGYWNMWVYPHSTINLAVTPKFATDYTGYTWSAQVQITPTTVGLKLGDAAASVHTLTGVEQQAPHFLSMRLYEVWQTSGGYWALFGHLYMDGTDVCSGSWHDPQHSYTIPQYLNSVVPVEVSLAVTDTTNTPTGLSGTVQRITHTSSGSSVEYMALSATLDGRRQVVDRIADEVNTAVYDGPLSTAPVGFPDVSGSTLLDVLNDIARSESGQLFSQTIGTLGSSTTYAELRARDRPTIPAAVFDIVNEGSGLPSFVRDITNVAEQVDVSGPNNTVTVMDATITGRYVTAGAGETVLYANDSDLRDWGQDRLYRGKNRAVRVQTFTVDACTTPTDRSADLLALVPGDRVQLTNIPAARLGFGTWDGWILGGSESHTPTSNQFTFSLTPATPAAAVADTDLYAAGGDVILGNTYTASATSMVVNTYNGAFMSSEVPYTIQVDQEQMTVTAVTGSTITVTRGANGTTAASHSVSAALEVTPTALYAY